MREPAVILPTNWASPDDHTTSWFVSEVLRRGHRWYFAESWPTAVKELHDDGNMIKVNISCHGQDGVVEYSNGYTLALLRLSRGTFSVNASCASRDQFEQLLKGLVERYPIDNARTGNIVPLVFWSQSSQHGPVHWRRNIEVPTWGEVKRNYPGLTFSELGGMMGWAQPEKGGQLLLWHGTPGTGKTWAIRALASEWRGWCQFEYVTDPDELFKDAAYLTQVLMRDDHFDEEKVLRQEPTQPTEGVGRDVETKKRWRCLVLEDTGELLMVDAKREHGQKLSRLLNVVDGLLGQGLNLLILITTNEEIKTLHPAVVRPGRCLYEVEFRPFDREEANAWLNGTGSSSTSPPYTLAQLYQVVMDFPMKQKPKVEAGFRR